MDINVNLNIVAPELCEAINNLAGAMVNMGSNNVSNHISNGQESAAPTTRKSRTSKTVEAVPVVTEVAPVVAETVTETTKVAETVTPPETAKAETPTVKITLVQVREKMKELQTAGKMNDIKDLFTRFGAKKLTEVPEEFYPELMKLAGEIA